MTTPFEKIALTTERTKAVNKDGDFKHAGQAAKELREAMEKHRVRASARKPNVLTPQAHYARWNRGG